MDCEISTPPIVNRLHSCRSSHRRGNFCHRRVCNLRVGESKPPARAYDAETKPDLGALADRTLTEPAEAANGTLRVQFDDSPMDEDFGLNDGAGPDALYPDSELVA